MAEPTSFYRVHTDEPHATRRKQMLAKYKKEIQALYGPNPNSKFVITAMVLSQLVLAYYIAAADYSWLALLAMAYVVGGTINHSLTLAIHELSHNLVFKTPAYNTYFGFFTSLPHAVPTFVTFRKYHLIHHRHQGKDGIDPDLPTAMEGRLFTSPLRKLFFLFFQPFFYALRPMLIYPGDVSMLEIGAYAFQITFNLIFFKVFGFKALAYLFLSTFLGSGLHPLAAHFVAEHYVWSDRKTENDDPIETYSYYGPLNYLTFFVGYHNEHHDFPQISGANLHKLHKIAPEFYDEVKETAHQSWVACMIRFVMDPQINPFARVLREK